MYILLQYINHYIFYQFFRLASYNLDAEKDLTAATSDGASVMVKFGGLAPFLLQLCFSHGIHLGVCDILYRAKEHQPGDTISPGGDSSGEEDDHEEEEEDENGAEVRAELHEAITKVRKISKIFRRSPKKNEVLQKYVKEERGEELSLMLDSKTRWNSLLAMVERYLKIQRSVAKALIDLEVNIVISEEEVGLLSSLATALQSVEMASKELAKRTCTLLTAEGTFNFLISTLENLETAISGDLLCSLKDRIGKRRQVAVISLLRYLHNPKSLEASSALTSEFKLSTKKEVITLAKNLLSRLFHATLEDEGSAEESNQVSMQCCILS